MRSNKLDITKISDLDLIMNCAKLARDYYYCTQIFHKERKRRNLPTFREINHYIWDLIIMFEKPDTLKKQEIADKYFKGNVGIVPFNARIRGFKIKFERESAKDITKISDSDLMLPYSTLAKMGYSQKHIKNEREKRGIYKEFKKEAEIDFTNYNPELTIKQNAKILKCAPISVSLYRKKIGISGTKKVVDWSNYDPKLKARENAEKMGCTINAVFVYKNRLKSATKSSKK